MTVDDSEISAGHQADCPHCGAEVALTPRKDDKGTPRKDDKGIPRKDDKGIPRKDDKGTLPRHGDPSDPVPPIKFDNSRRKTIDEEMDMTPMVDVTFLLLIFFMVTAAFSLQRSFEVPAPDNNQPSQNTVEEIQENDDYIIVRIDAYNTFWVVSEDTEYEAASEQELLVRLREAKRGGSTGVTPTRLLVIAHGDALHEKVVTALDAGTGLGMEQVKLVTVEEDI